MNLLIGRTQVGRFVAPVDNSLLGRHSIVVVVVVVIVVVHGVEVRMGCTYVVGVVICEVGENSRLRSVLLLLLLLLVLLLLMIMLLW